jgi:hypothetical protein
MMATKEKITDTWDHRAKMLVEPEAKVTDEMKALAINYLKRRGAEDLAPILGLSAVA